MSSMSEICVSSLNTARPMRAAFEARVAPFEPALAPVPAPAVATVMRMSGIACPNARPGSSTNVSTSKRPLASPSKNASGFSDSTVVNPTNVSAGSSTHFACNSSKVIWPDIKRPKSYRTAYPPRVQVSLIKSMVASTKPSYTDLSVRVAASIHVRSGSFEMPELRALIRRVPDSLT